MSVPLDAVFNAVANRPDGATLIEVAVQLSPPAPQRNVQRWLQMLIEQNRIVRVGGSHASRYKVRDGAEDDAAPGASPLARAVQRLVNQPISERTPVGFNRLFFDAYRPNETYYLPDAVRTRLRTPIGAADAPPWREPAVFGRIVSDLAWRSGWLESQNPEAKLTALKQPDVTAWLAQPKVLNARREVQLVWNQRAAFDVIVSRAPDVALTQDLLRDVYGVLSGKRSGAKDNSDNGPAADDVNAATGDKSNAGGEAQQADAFGGQARLVGGRARLAGGQASAFGRQARLTGGLASGSDSHAGLLRKESIALARTVYCSPCEPCTIEACFQQILGAAAAISDPIEQAFFTLVHLSYLQPFATLNLSITCLVVNVPLLRAGLPPVTFAGVRGGDFLDGLRGIWELNRTELLRDLFIAAYDDCRSRCGTGKAES